MEYVTIKGEVKSAMKACEEAGIMKSLYHRREVDFEDPQERFEAALKDGEDLRAMGFDPATGQLLVEIEKPGSDAKETMSFTDACYLYKSIRRRAYNETIRHPGIDLAEAIKAHRDSVTWDRDDFDPFAEWSGASLAKLFCVSVDSFYHVKSGYFKNKQQALEHQLAVKNNMHKPKNDALAEAEYNKFIATTLRQGFEAACYGFNSEGESLINMNLRIDGTLLMGDRRIKALEDEIEALKKEIKNFDTLIVYCKEREKKAEEAYEKALAEKKAAEKRYNELTKQVNALLSGIDALEGAATKINDKVEKLKKEFKKKGLDF